MQSSSFWCYLSKQRICPPNFTTHSLPDANWIDAAILSEFHDILEYLIGERLDMRKHNAHASYWQEFLLGCMFRAELLRTTRPWFGDWQSTILLFSLDWQSIMALRSILPQWYRTPPSKCILRHAIRKPLPHDQALCNAPLPSGRSLKFLADC